MMLFLFLSLLLYISSFTYWLSHSQISLSIVLASHSYIYISYLCQAPLLVSSLANFTSFICTCRSSLLYMISTLMCIQTTLLTSVGSPSSLLFVNSFDIKKKTNHLVYPFCLCCSFSSKELCEYHSIRHA